MCGVGCTSSTATCPPLMFDLVHWLLNFKDAIGKCSGVIKGHMGTLGTAVHACTSRMTSAEMGRALGKIVAARRRVRAIERSGVEVKVFRECRVERMLKRDSTMRKFYDEILDTGPLLPRDAYVSVSLLARCV